MRMLFVLTFGLLGPGTEAAVYRVPDDFHTVGEAVRAAGEGDTVRVGSGTYRERVVLEREIHLLGEGAETCILKGSGGDNGGTVVTVQRRSRLKGLTIRDGKNGIYVRVGASLEIEDCRIVANASDGIGFETDFNTVLSVQRCLVTQNVDGIDLESTQGVILDTEFLANRDDGLDYDGDAGVLVSGCRFADNGDDGIEIRLARETHALILGSSFEGNGEDGLEIINSPIAGGHDNVLAVEKCRFRGNRRYGVGFVGQGRGREIHTGEMAMASVYAVGNSFGETGEGDVSPNYVPVFQAPREYPDRVRATVDRGGKAEVFDLPIRIPLLVGIYNLRPTTDGTMARDVEGVTVRGSEVYVADDGARQIYVLDRKTGEKIRAIPTDPFGGCKLRAEGPEGLDVRHTRDRDVLLLADDSGRGLFSLSLEQADSGRVLDRQSTDHVGRVEGVAAVCLNLVLASGRNQLFPVDGRTLRATGPPVSVRIDEFGEHIAGVGSDEDDKRLLATLSGYVPGEDRRNHRSAFFETDPDVTSLRRFWHLGPFSEDPRGIAVSDGLVYVTDGRSPFRDADTGEMNRGGRKVFVFLLDDDASALHRALSVLPVRRRSGGP